MIARITVHVLTITIGTSLLACTQRTATVDPDLEEAVRWYTGVGGRVDNQRARELLMRAATDNDPLSRMWVARVYSTGRMGFDENKDSARTIAEGVIASVERAANQGVAEAQFLIGTAYAEGLGRETDEVRAVDWYRRAAERGHVLAQHNLGNVYFTGTGVIQNDSAAVHWWSQAAMQGDAIPQLRLGTMYETGRGVTRNLDEARRWYGESARRGNRDAAEALERLTQAEH